MLNSELYKGTLRIIVLNLLEQHQKLYGYELVELVKQKSKNKLLITEGALYPTLHRLEKAGLIKYESLFHGKRVRKYYSLTSEGKLSADSELHDYKTFVKTINKVLKK